MIGADIFFQCSLAFRNLSQCLAVNRLRLQIGRHLTAEIFVCQHYGTVHKVAEDSHKFAVVALLEIFPGKVIVLCLWSICTQNIAENILLTRELLHIFVEPYSPVP